MRTSSFNADGLAVMIAAGMIGAAFAALPTLLGGTWQLNETVGLVTILAGAFTSGWWGNRLGVAVVAALAASCFTAWLPDTRHLIPGSFAHQLIPFYLGVYACWIIAVTLASCGMVRVGEYTRAQRAHRLERFCSVCRVCGYSLRGLPEPRCPECGTAFRPLAEVHSESVGSPTP